MKCTQHLVRKHKHIWCFKTFLFRCLLFGIYHLLYTTWAKTRATASSNKNNKYSWFSPSHKNELEQCKRSNYVWSKIRKISGRFQMVMKLFRKLCLWAKSAAQLPNPSGSVTVVGRVDTLRDAALICTDWKLTFAFDWRRPWWPRIAAPQRAYLSVQTDIPSVIDLPTNNSAFIFPGGIECPERNAPLPPTSDLGRMGKREKP